MIARAVLITCALAAAWACGGNSSTPKKPDAAVDAFSSACGHPGDLGNEQGVGKFCMTLSDCSSTGSARLCSVIGDSTTHFCTHTCTGSADTSCGTATTCECNASNQCGCTPTSCIM